MKLLAATAVSLSFVSLVHAPRVLLWVAEHHHGYRGGRGSLREEMTETRFHASNETNSKYAKTRT